MKRQYYTNAKKFQDTISVNLRSYFCHKKEFSRLFEDISDINCFHNELVQMVSCYKYELGQVLVDIGTTFNALFENLLELCYVNDKDTQTQVEKKIKQNAINEQEIEKFKLQYEERIFHLKLKLKAKDLDLKLSKDSATMYEEEI